MAAPATQLSSASSDDESPLLAQARRLAEQDATNRARAAAHHHHAAPAATDVERRTVPTRGGSRLQAYVYRPVGAEPHPDVALTLVHQCTALGGCAAAVHDIASACAASGFLVVSFDMRGTGGSPGLCSFGPWPLLSGCAEVADVICVAEWVRDELQRDTWLVGVSAGAPVASAAVEAVDSVRGYIGIAPVMGLLTLLLFGQHHPRILLSRKPKLWVIGTQDCFTSVACFRLFFALARSPKAFHVQPGAGHFDLEVGSYGQLHARLIRQFLNEGESTNNTGIATLWPSLFTGGPCCLATLLLLAILYFEREAVTRLL